MAFFVFVVTIFLEIMDMWDIHSYACTWSAIVIFLAVRGSCLKVISSRGSSVNETSWEIFARVLTWKVPVRLMTMGIISTSALGCRRFVVLVGVVDRCGRCVQLLLVCCRQLSICIL